MVQVQDTCNGTKKLMKATCPHDYQHPGYIGDCRVRGQAQGSLSFNGDDSAGLGAKVPLVGNDKNLLSAIGKVILDYQMHTVSKGFGLTLDNA